MDIVVASDDSDFTFSVRVSNMGTESGEILKPSLMLGGCVIGTILSMLSVYLLCKREETHFMKTACYISIMILSIFYFELFGVYVMIALQYNSKYFQYLTISGIACFLSSMITNKLSVIFFLYQYANHPQIDANSWKSPRTKFYVITIIVQLACYLSAFFLCKYPGFTYYMLPFYFFPLSHIANTCVKKTKVCFRWYKLELI